MTRITRRRFLLTAAGSLAAAAVGCQGGVPTIFGYQLGADALYNSNIRTVFVPVSRNQAFQTEPYRGLERDLTKAVVREIGARTRFRVVSDPSRADTELLMNVVDINKTLLNRNPQNTIREGDVVITVDVLWRDLRDGTIYSAPRPVPQPGAPLPPPPGLQPELPQFDPDVAPVPAVAVLPVPLTRRLVATGRMLPELGETNASAEKRALDSMAIQIVSMMEKPWGLSNCPPQ
jgi:hypothetical protein